MNTMIQQWLQGRKTYLTCLAVGVLLFGSWQKWWQLPPEIYAGLAALATAFLRAGIAKVQGSQGDPAARRPAPRAAPAMSIPAINPSAPGPFGPPLISGAGAAACPASASP